ncbi:Methyltransf-25 domain-containing protein [Mycena indigotica]|uniref:Methyltransf-25 domain-containing protein n=1 Tax=Mycena indigotica TaxID=2126181 RepID=A0A8H6SZC7_9AGAR|nr:Methyltransf-25 domain-containing protein [Mycena indigotica]KAF7307436.1 Methyltransf-25 domain-containing protein [Mycena indigotica]
MAAMEIARSLSNSLLPTPPGSATAESFRSKAASPDPHYRLSRLNSPPSTPALRSPSLMSRSVSGGFTFKKEKDREPTPEKMDERPPSRSLFNLRKKSSLASMASNRVDDPNWSRSSSGGKSASSVSSISETPLRTPTFPLPPVNNDKSRQQFQHKDHWRVQRRVKLQPYPDAPYMQSFESVVLDSERYTHQLIRRLLPDASPTFHQYKDPPQSVLELGCGIGAWLQDAARLWPSTQFVGFDLVNIAFPTLTDGSLPNVSLQLGDFLNYALPFGKNTFDLVRMANLGLCVPFDKWDDVLREVHRVLVPGGRVELIDDQTIFPYGDAPAEESPEATVSHLATPTAPTVSASTPTPRPRITADSSTFFDSDSDDDSDESKLDSSMTSSSDSASERSSFTDTASTLVGEASERGSVELKKLSSDFSAPPQLEFEATHRPFSGVDHLIISIPPPAPLATVEIGPGPMTPVPHTRAGVPNSPPLSAATLDAISDVSAPPTPSTGPTELADEASAGPWSSQKSAARDLERVFQRMLGTHFKVHTRPSEIYHSTLTKVFATVDLPAAMHLKLAPLDAPSRQDLVHQGVPERRKKNRLSMALPPTKEFEPETPIPTGLSAKAAERLGIAGGGPGAGPPPPTLRRQPTKSTLSGTPEESDEDDFDEDDDDLDDEFFSDSDDDEAPPTRPERGASDWVAPSEWDAPPERTPTLPRMASSSMLASSSSKTITPSISSKTITSSKTIKILAAAPPTHTRNGSAASTASALSTASAGSNVSNGAYVESALGPQKYAEKRVQHPGLILWPSTFIPMAPQELEYHSTKHIQTLLGCKPALAQYVAMFTDSATGKRFLSEEEFEQALWDYESFIRPRFNWPQLAEARMEDDDGELSLTTPASANFQQVPRPVIDLQGRVTMPFGPQELTHVRTFRIYGAAKAGGKALA